MLQFVERMNEERARGRQIARLKKYRELASMSQSQLAEATDIPVKTIQQYEQRRKNINKAQAEYVLRLAQVLCCKPEQLLE